MEEKDKNNDEPKNNDESKKNNEPQHIGDIMNNIPFVLDALARERKKLNDLYTKAIMDNLASHHIKLQILDALYHQA
ncbi:TPA: hypothetical protein DCZ39_05810 [Patescibacteria group bacterium]|nr:hypothetical protein [Candidatus Gracilibacteria bacterium]